MMAKKGRKASTKQFSSHIDPRKEEELKWIKTEVENNVRRIVMLIKSSVNQSNRDSNQRRKTELIQLVEDFHKKYHSLYSLYDNLKGEVREKCSAKNDRHGVDSSSSSSSSSSVSSSDSESYFSPEEAAAGGGGGGGRSGGSSGSESSNKRIRKPHRSREEKPPNIAVETPDSEDVILKDTLTSTTEVNVDGLDSTLGSSSFDDRVPRPEELFIKDLSVQSDENESKLMKECSNLKEKLVEKEELLLCVTKEYEDRVASLKLELENSRAKMREFEEKMERKLEKLRACEERKGMEDQIESLNLQKAALEERLECRSNELKQLESANSSLQAKIKEMETKDKEKEDEISALLQKNHENRKDERSHQVNGMTEKINSLQQEILSMSNQKLELETLLEEKCREISECHSEVESMKQKISLYNHQKSSFNDRSSRSIEKEEGEEEEDLRSRIAQQEHTIKKLKNQHIEMKEKFEEANTNFQNAERKIDEMLEELRKKYEDSLRILSRRIRVAEQLHTENKEWYLKTRETYERENKELKELATTHNNGVKRIQEMSVVANEALASLDAVSLQFEKCTSNFVSRISSVSCELNFAKDWVSRKQKAMAHVKGDVDCLVSQLGVKEREIMVYREKVWKSENKVRELEKIVKESEDAMCDLKEEKREAIRQLCVWIDYHRSRCDYYKKMLAEVGCFIKTP
ncbi:unnamed protein product [Cuscuta campestris]|uniref:NAB domain-containing protein n=1 Tax=Cuscuta campestris TaxID=132261 RepID=A0A484KNZ0_9ASTE|nr:unnamed protein product [Cuscuta campestris]